MSETKFSTNMSANSIAKQYEKETTSAFSKPTSENTFDVKNYLQVTLDKNEQEKTLTIRLLPFTKDSETPFEKVYAHLIKVDKEVQANGWKRLICPHKNKPNEPLEKCPFCSTAAEAKKLKYASSSQVEKDKYYEIEKANTANEMWIVRCIERGHEEDGPKFWMFSHQGKKRDGIYDKMMALNESRRKKDPNYSIFDLNVGKDLDITIKRTVDKKLSITITDNDERTALTDDIATGVKWIEDSKTWQDVFKVKRYEYMEILINGGVPIYDKEQKCYIDKKDKKEQESTEDDSPVPNRYEELPQEQSVVNNITPSPNETDELPF